MICANDKSNSATDHIILRVPHILPKMASTCSIYETRGMARCVPGSNIYAKAPLHHDPTSAILTMTPAILGYMPGNLVYTRMLALLTSTYRVSHQSTCQEAPITPALSSASSAHVTNAIKQSLYEKISVYIVQIRTQCSFGHHLIRATEEGHVGVLNVGVGKGGGSDNSGTRDAREQVAARHAVGLHLHARRLPSIPLSSALH